MGSGRKRPADRSPTPVKADGEGGRKKKKGKKSKQSKDSTSEQNHQSSLESTATAEGKIMAQVCSTFNRLEQSRFEAFRRSTFPTDAISKYVAHCLIQEHGGGIEVGGTPRRPVLSEICAPDQAEEIAIVVSTLAKAYAQRLVTAARRLSKTPNQPILPEEILQVFHEREANGQDPGFFLQPAASTNNSASLLQDETYQRKRLAALHAQEEFDKLYPPLSEEVEEDEGCDAESNADQAESKDGKKDESMDIDAPSPSKTAQTTPVATPEKQTTS